MRLLLKNYRARIQSSSPDQSAFPGASELPPRATGKSPNQLLLDCARERLTAKKSDGRFLPQAAAQPSRNRIVPVLCFTFLFAELFFLNSCFTYSPLTRSSGLPSSENSNRSAPPALAKKQPPAINQADSNAQPLPTDPPIVFQDDLDREGLKKVIRNQLDVMQDVDEFEPVRLGELTLTKGDLKKNLEAFLNLLNQNPAPNEFNRRMRKEFILYRAGQGKKKKFLFTGYYTPVIAASPVKTGEYIYPLYRIPDDPVEPGHAGHSKKSLLSGSPQSWKEYTRRQIDDLGVLKNQKLEIAWLKDDLERFFLHVQGSGVLQFPNGKRQGVRFAGTNQYGYRGVGKLMVKDGLLRGKGEKSMQGIKKYLRDHPAEIPKYLYQNKRYIFFAYNDEGPRGSGGGELVEGRSIATDKSIYPAGGLALIFVRKPVLNEKNEIVRWKRAFRFVVDQDTGGDIKGPGRGDLFFGIGQRPGIMAGNFKEWGEVYYLIKRK